MASYLHRLLTGHGLQNVIAINDEAQGLCTGGE